jgi:hypothetical protein
LPGILGRPRLASWAGPLARHPHHGEGVGRDLVGMGAKCFVIMTTPPATPRECALLDMNFMIMKGL